MPPEATLELAVEHNRRGELGSAEACCRAVLVDRPEDPEALALLGVVLFRSGRAEEAQAVLRRALELRPEFVEARSTLENILAALGRPTEAEARESNRRGLARHRERRLAEAEACFRRAVELMPELAEGHNNLGAVLFGQGKTAEALARFREAARLAPNLADAHSNSGAALATLGEFAQAADCFRRALHLRPGEPATLKNLEEVCRRQARRNEAEARAWCARGNTHQREGRGEDAEACYQRALELRPELAEAHNNLGVLLLARGKAAEALPHFRKTVCLHPDSAEAHNNVGSALARLGEFEQAEPNFQRAVRLRPVYPEAWKHLGEVLRELGRLEEAESCFREAIRQQPDLAEGHSRLGAIRLLIGRFEAGWEEYEWRLRRPSAVLPRVALPVWNGSSLTGRTVLLCLEQGYGDVFQFVRFAAPLKQRGATVVLWCPAELVELLSSCPGLDQVTSGNPPVGCDCYVMLLSLPHRLGITLDNIPANVPYLSPPERLRHSFRDLADLPGLKVGIAWQGNPAHPEDRMRSVRLEEFAPLAEVPGVSLVSLQKGPGAEQLALFAQRRLVLDLGPRLADWSDTAAALNRLDLVISVDSAVAHLAGALGKPTWVALRSASEWRWLLDREDSPWYPSLRLFRQTRPGDWTSVFSRIVGELRLLLSSAQAPQEK
jgi:tetratricopeptide (TPR) repeat protein